MFNAVLRISLPRFLVRFKMTSIHRARKEYAAINRTACCSLSRKGVTHMSAWTSVRHAARRKLVGCRIIFQSVREILGREPKALLLRHASFTPSGKNETDQTSDILGSGISYAAPSDPLLAEFRTAFHLDAIAGVGTEVERWRRVMEWVHQLTVRSPNPKPPQQWDGLFLTRTALEHGQRFNCHMYAIVLNEALLSLGYASRMVHLYPITDPPKESHFVVVAFSRDLDKWVQLDADTCSIVTDEQGTPLHPGEIRMRIIQGEKLFMSDSIQSNGLVSRWLDPKWFVKWISGRYLTKNLFRFECAARSTPGYESLPSERTYVQLIPDGYRDEWLKLSPRKTARGNYIYYTRDESLFWRRPDPEVLFSLGSGHDSSLGADLHS